MPATSPPSISWWKPWQSGCNRCWTHADTRSANCSGAMWSKNRSDIVRPDETIQSHHQYREETKLKKRLEMLEQLQEIDLQVDALKSAQNGLHAEMNGVEQGLDAAREELASMQSRVAQLGQERSEE